HDPLAEQYNAVAVTDFNTSATDNTSVVFEYATSGVFGQAAAEVSTPTQYVIATPGDGIVSVTCQTDTGGPVSRDLLSSFSCPCVGPISPRYMFSDLTSSPDIGMGRVAPDLDMCVAYSTSGLTPEEGWTCSYETTPLEVCHSLSGVIGMAQDGFESARHYMISVPGINEMLTSFECDPSYSGKYTLKVYTYDGQNDIMFAQELWDDSYGYCMGSGSGLMYNSDACSVSGSVLSQTGFSPALYVISFSADGVPATGGDPGWTVQYSTASKVSVVAEQTRSHTSPADIPGPSTGTYVITYKMLGLHHPVSESQPLTKSPLGPGCSIISMSIVADLQRGDTISTVLPYNGPYEYLEPDTTDETTPFEYVVDRTMTCEDGTHDAFTPYYVDTAAQVSVSVGPSSPSFIQSMYDIEVVDYTATTYFVSVEDLEDGMWRGDALPLTNEHRVVFGTKDTLYGNPQGQIDIKCSGDIGEDLIVALYSGNEYGSTDAELASMTNGGHIAFEGYSDAYGMTLTFHAESGIVVAESLVCAVSHAEGEVLPDHSGTFGESSAVPGNYFQYMWVVYPTDFDWTETQRYSVDLSCSPGFEADPGWLMVVSIDCADIVDGTYLDEYYSGPYFGWDESDQFSFHSTYRNGECLGFKFYRRSVNAGDPEAEWSCSYTVHVFPITHMWLVVLRVTLGVCLLAVVVTLVVRRRKRASSSKTYQTIVDETVDADSPPVDAQSLAHA
ncbi:hypothetical protein KIPB_009138, partial [Kipferlia bialata]